MQDCPVIPTSFILLVYAFFLSIGMFRLATRYVSNASVLFWLMTIVSFSWWGYGIWRNVGLSYDSDGSTTWELTYWQYEAIFAIWFHFLCCWLHNALSDCEGQRILSYDDCAHIDFYGNGQCTRIKYSVASSKTKTSGQKQSRLKTLITYDVILICAKPASGIVWLVTWSHKRDAAPHRLVWSEGWQWAQQSLTMTPCIDP